MKGIIQMPTNKKQLLRMVKMVADLRKNSYPNANTWVKKFEALVRGIFATLCKIYEKWGYDYFISPFYFRNFGKN